MRPKARLESEDEIIARLQKENEDNPESTNYLITDEYISNVLPETTVENLKKNIKEVVKVYENEGKESEIKAGKVKVERNQITSKSGNSGSRYGIYNYSTGMITLKDVNITLSSYSVYGIYNNS